jgi:hypothetical protein
MANLIEASMRTDPFSPPFAILALVTCALAGCGGDETARIKLVPVSGTVTLNGKPLEGAEITFTPDPANAKVTPGSDTTGPEGNYKAMFRGRSGLAPGKYKVVVAKVFLPPGVRLFEGMDLHMLEVAAQSRSGDSKEMSKTAPTQVQGEFEREVPAEGGVVDVDVKGKPAPISVPKP